MTYFPLITNFGDHAALDVVPVCVFYHICIYWPAYWLKSHFSGGFVCSFFSVTCSMTKSGFNHSFRWRQSYVSLWIFFYVGDTSTVFHRSHRPMVCHPSAVLWYMHWSSLWPSASSWRGSGAVSHMPFPPYFHGTVVDVVLVWSGQTQTVVHGTDCKFSWCMSRVQWALIEVLIPGIFVSGGIW